MSQMEFGDLKDTLREERERIKRDRDAGTTCGACGQFCKAYPRQIHSTMARAIIGAFKLVKGEPNTKFHITTVMKLPGCLNVFGDFQKFVYWGLVEEVKEEPVTTGAKTSGLWQLTAKGINFVRNKERVPKKIYIYNDTVLGHSDEQVQIVDCIKKKFDYHELMNDL